MNNAAEPSQPAALAPRFAVLMTATVDPSAFADSLQRSDPAIRLADYQKALRFWDRIDDARIGAVVFCENAGADLEPLRRVATQTKRAVELIGFDGNIRPRGVHYGYSELGIIDHALHSSALLGRFSHFIKATGRLTFPGVGRLLDQLPAQFDAAVDHRRRYRGETGFALRARTPLMVFSRDFYMQKLRGRRDDMIGRYPTLEEFIAVTLDAEAEDARLIRRFAAECPPSGVDAFQNKDFNSPSLALKNMARALLRRALPGVWL